MLLLPSVLKKGLKDTVEMDYSDSSLIYCSNYSGQYRVGATILAFPLFFAILANSLVVSNEKKIGVILMTQLSNLRRIPNSFSIGFALP